MANYMDNEMTNAEFICKATELINNLPPCVGDLARLGHWLSMALNRLETAAGLQPGKTPEPSREELRAALRDCVQCLIRLPDREGAFRVTCIQQAEKALK